MQVLVNFPMILLFSVNSAFVIGSRSGSLVSKHCYWSCSVKKTIWPRVIRAVIDEKISLTLSGYT